MKKELKELIKNKKEEIYKAYNNDYNKLSSDITYLRTVYMIKVQKKIVGNKPLSPKDKDSDSYKSLLSLLKLLFDNGYSKTIDIWMFLADWSCDHLFYNDNEIEDIIRLKQYQMETEIDLKQLDHDIKLIINTIYNNNKTGDDRKLDQYIRDTFTENERFNDLIIYLRHNNFNYCDISILFMNWRKSIKSKKFLLGQEESVEK